MTLPIETWRAFAKLNLELRVLGKRPDGYHSIETVFQTIDLCDEIRVFASEGDELAFTSNREPADDSNLVVRAARAFETHTGQSARVRLDLEKRIPAGAGLGGGSADAAATLLGLNRYFGTAIPGGELHRILTGLGSDVPFFLLGGRALGLGRGEILFPLGDLESVWFVLVCPEIHVATREAYARTDAYSRPADSGLNQATEPTMILGFCAHFVPGLTGSGLRARLNDFEEPLFGRFPELAELTGRLRSAGATSAGLSGSGSALFGVFGSEEAARGAARDLEDGHRVMVVRPLGRQGYLSRMLGAPGRRPV